MKQLLKPIRHTYEWTNITIGSNLNAVLHAYKNKNYLLINNDISCHFYNKLSEDIKVAPFVDRKSGKSELELFEDISFFLSFSGKNPFGTRINSINIDSDKSLLSVTFDETKNTKIHYDNLRIFDTNNVNGVPFKYNKTITGYHVYDKFKCQGFRRHGFQVIEDKEHQLAKRLFFKKELMTYYVTSESFIEDLNDISTSPNIVRIKTIEMMRNSGIGIGKNGHHLHALSRNANEIFDIQYLKKDNIEIGGSWKK